MHPSHLIVVNLIVVVVMLSAFAVIDRYAKRHPYGTGHFGKMERKRRAKEARRRGVELPPGEAKARNEALMAEMLAPLQPEPGARTSSRSDAEPPRRNQR